MPAAGSWMGMHEGRGRISANATPTAPDSVPGTTANPRVVYVTAGPGYRFTPADVTVLPGETITFVVTAMGPYVHEFKVGPLEAVKADAVGLPEITDLSMMQSSTLTYTFDGPGPYGFACHEPGHFEAGMWGTITVVG